MPQSNFITGKWWCEISGARPKDYLSDIIYNPLFCDHGLNLELARKGQQTEGESSSDDDKNPKYRRHSWSEVVKELPVTPETVVASATCHSLSRVSIPVPTSPRKHTVCSTNLNPSGIYTGEQAIALLVKA